MEILNTKERKSAFLKFLLFFIITVGLFVFAIYFDTKVSSKQNDILIEKLDRYEKEFARQRDFTNKTRKIISLIDSLNTPGVQYNYIGELIDKEMAAIEISLNRDTLMNQALFKQTFSSLLDLKVAQDKLRTSASELGKIKQYKESIEEYRKELEKCQVNLDLCKRMN